MSLELPALLSECKATTMPMVTNESYLPLSMDYTNVHSSASALALLPGPLNYLSTGFHLETFRGGGHKQSIHHLTSAPWPDAVATMRTTDVTRQRINATETSFV